jgi:hypothetical protein
MVWRGARAVWVVSLALACSVDDRQPSFSGEPDDTMLGNQPGMGGSAQGGSGNALGGSGGDASAPPPDPASCAPGSTEVPCVMTPPACDPSAGPCIGTCPGCLIDDVCVAAGEADPDNACAVCAPDRNASAWSNDDAKACDDGLYCTEGDVCSAGVCSGTPRSCEDGIECNGVSQCDEEGQRCTPDVNQCPGGDFCDLESQECVSTCDGCLVANVCVQDGAALAGNACMVCDTSRSTTAYSPAVGVSCGAAATQCSAQDTCDESGVCRANHAVAGSACGNAAASACDDADSCDGNGGCRTNVVGNGTPCNDARFCTVGDECQAGVCVADAERDCGALSTCVEATDQCRCNGCSVGGSCVAPGTVNANNPCQVCDPARSATAFSGKVEGAFCGSGQQCSATSLCRFTGTGLLSAGFWDTCVIEDGQVFCVSAGGPIDLGANTTALQISTGQHHTCALLANGNVRCWGDSLGNDRGQLGTTTVQSEDGVIFIGNVQLGGRAASISAGTDTTCAVMETGAVRCWGVNTVGQLGYGHTNNVGDDAADFPLADVNLGAQRVIQVETGNNHTCAILEGGALRCWGRGFAGALGYGNETDQLSPPTTNVPVGLNVVQVATGSAHTCALTNAGFLRCWGSNSVGELGYGHTQNIGDDETPAQAVTRTVTLPTGGTRTLGGDIAAGGSVAQVQIRQGQREGQKTCVRFVGGAVRCWGGAGQGGLGYAHRSNIGDNETPVEAETLTARIDAQGNPVLLGGNLALGGSATTLADGGDQCALRTDSQVVCWRGPEQLPTLVAF